MAKWWVHLTCTMKLSNHAVVSDNLLDRELCDVGEIPRDTMLLSLYHEL